MYPDIFEKKNLRFQKKYASTRIVFGRPCENAKQWKYDSIPHRACVMIWKMTYCIIVFENLRFRPSTNEKPAFSKIFTPESDFKKMHF